VNKVQLDTGGTIMPKQYSNLVEQVRAYLTRHGPSHVSKVTMGLRHNAKGKQINVIIDANDDLIRFDYEYHSYRRLYRRQCVRLETQKTEDYRDEYQKTLKVPGVLPEVPEVLEFL
jgi:hypothetical protein